MTVVVVPAHNEEATIGACLAALGAQRGAGPFRVILVANRCTDGTVAAARAALPSVRVLEGPGGGPGPARKLGMDLAATWLPPHGLIATTDADSVVAPDWLARQLEALAAGADAVGGLIELEDGLPASVLAARAVRAAERFVHVLAHTPDSEHHHFSGASLGLTADAYRRVGGMPPLAVLEDEALERALREHGLRIVRLRSVRVRTSARLVGRASAGLAHDLAALCDPRPG